MVCELDGESAESCLIMVYLHQRPSALVMLRTQISQNTYAELTAAALQLCAEESAAKGAVAGGGTKTIPEHGNTHVLEAPGLLCLSASNLLPLLLLLLLLVHPPQVDLEVVVREVGRDP